MNSNIFKSVFVSSFLAATMSACQTEPEVGSTLYPVVEENYSPKAFLYVNGSEGNQVTLSATKSPLKITLSNDTASFYARLSSPVDHDVVVTIAPTTADIVLQSDESLIDSSAIAIKSTSVVIPQGQQISSEPIKISLKESESLMNLEKGKNGVIDIALISVTGAELPSTFNTVRVKTNFAYEYLNPNGTLNYDKAISQNSYIVSVSRGSGASRLNDGNYSTYYYQYAGFQPEITLDFQREVKLSGLGVISAFTQYDYGVKEMEIFTSNDGQTWTSQGQVTAASAYDNTTPFPAVFYEAIPCRYAKIKLLSSFHNVAQPLVAVSEVLAYE